MLKFSYVNGYRKHVPESISNFKYKLSMISNYHQTSQTFGLIQALGRDMLRDLMYVEDVLARMTGLEALKMEDFGLSVRHDVADTADVQVWTVREKHTLEMFHEHLDFVSGAIRDPFLGGNDQEGQEGFQQAAVLNLHKCRVLVRHMIGIMTGNKDL